MEFLEVNEAYLEKKLETGWKDARKVIASLLEILTQLEQWKERQVFLSMREDDSTQLGQQVCVALTSASPGKTCGIMIMLAKMPRGAKKKKLSWTPVAVKIETEFESKENMDRVGMMIEWRDEENDFDLILDATPNSIFATGRVADLITAHIARESTTN